MQSRLQNQAYVLCWSVLMDTTDQKDSFTASNEKIETDGLKIEDAPTVAERRIAFFDQTVAPC